VPKIKSIQAIIINDLAKQFPKIFEQSVSKIPDIKCSLQLRHNSKPVFIKPREIPYAIRKSRIGIRKISKKQNCHFNRKKRLRITISASS